MMKLLLLVKAVPDENGGLAMNHDDKNMLELALQMLDREAVSIDLICRGPESAKTVLRLGLALGAERAFLVPEPSELCGANAGTASSEAKAAGQGDVRWNFDPGETAAVLAETIRSLEPYDALLCGYRSEDLQAGAVGLMTAELLGVPIITNVFEFEEDSCGDLLAKRKISGELQQVRAPRPCLLCGLPGRDRLRGPSFFQIQESFQKELTVLDAGQMQGELRLFRWAPADRRRKKQIGRSEEEQSRVRNEIVRELIVCRAEAQKASGSENSAAIK